MSSEAKREANRRKALNFWKEVRSGKRQSPSKSRLSARAIQSIIKAKQRRGLLQRLADQFKVSPSYISYIRSGRRLKNHAKDHAKAKTAEAARS